MWEIRGQSRRRFVRRLGARRKKKTGCGASGGGSSIHVRGKNMLS